MAHLQKAFLIFVLILSAQLMTVNGEWGVCAVIGAVAGGAAAVVGAPLILGAAGFGAGGIAAGSLAAKTMSVVYTSGTGLSALSALQAAGAAGVGLKAATAGAAVGSYVSQKVFCNDGPKC